MTKSKVPTKGPAMRVAVAKDVLKLLSKGMVAETGTYLRVESSRDGAAAIRNPASGKSLQKAIGANPQYCHVCAKGAIVLAHTHLLDGISSLPFIETSYAARKIWGTVNADLIEASFESVPDDGAGAPGKTRLDAAIRFGARYADNEARMRAIMRNVIANNGTFKP